MLAALRAVSVYVDWGTVTDSEGTKFQTYFASFVPGPLKYHTLALVTTDISKDAQHGALMLRDRIRSRSSGRRAVHSAALFP